MFAALLVLCAAVSACGKKGPPLAPVVHVPAAVDKLAAQRVGNDIYLSVTIPTENIDRTTPADVTRIDIFGVTSLTTPPRARIFEIATKIGSIDVQPPVRLEDGRNQVPAPVPSPTSTLPAQGATVTIRDTLASADMVPKELPTAPARGATPPASANPQGNASPFPRRYYIAVAQSDRGRTGPPGMLLDVPLPPLPDPPTAPTIEDYTQDDVTITWEPAGGVLGFVLENPAPIEAPPVDDIPAAQGGAATLPAGPTMYNVYREPAPSDPVPAGTASPVPPVPLNATPLTELRYVDKADIQLGRERCYAVRAVRGAAQNLVIGAPSERGCRTLIDRFPPEAPTSLSATATEGVINLLWDPNGEADLGGYLVLRGRAGDATLQPLTTTPVMDTRYADRDVVPGIRYVYAVQAVDMQSPPNVSGESNRAEETAR